MNNTQEKKSTNPLKTALTGAVVGAGITVAGTMLLKDEKRRKKMKKVLNQVKDQGVEYLKDMQVRGQKEIKKQLPEVMKQEKRTAKKIQKKIEHKSKAAL